APGGVAAVAGGVGRALPARPGGGGVGVARGRGTRRGGAAGQDVPALGGGRGADRLGRPAAAVEPGGVARPGGGDAPRRVCVDTLRRAVYGPRRGVLAEPVRDPDDGSEVVRQRGI